MRILVIKTIQNDPTHNSPKDQDRLIAPLFLPACSAEKKCFLVENINKLKPSKIDLLFSAEIRRGLGALNESLWLLTGMSLLNLIYSLKC